MQERIRIGDELATVAVAVRRLIEAHIHNGRYEQAAEELTRHDAWGKLADHLHCCWVLTSRAKVRIATGDLHAGLADHLECGERLLGRGIPIPRPGPGARPRP